MFKAMILVRRKAGTTMQEFMDYYETKHAVLAHEKVPNVVRYVRRYLTPFGNDAYPGDDSGLYDAAIEICFENEAEFMRGMAMLSDPETAAIMAVDEEKLFDRSMTRFFTVVECATAIS
jgi:hypothetical protein